MKFEFASRAFKIKHSAKFYTENDMKQSIK